MLNPEAADQQQVLGGQAPGAGNNPLGDEDDDWEAVEHADGQEDNVPEGEQPQQQQADDTDTTVEDELCPRDASRMELTAEERQWALAIKEAIEENNELDNLSDFLYAQYALIDRDNVQQAVQRAHHFQIFRQEYRLLDTLEEGKHFCHQFVRLLPRVMLSVCFNQEEGNYVLVMDIATFQERELHTEEDYRTLLGFVYNVGHFLSPDFTAIRKGIFFVIECDGYDWQNLSMRTRRRLWTESLAIYPYKIRQIKYFHTGTYANLAAALMKRFLPVDVYSKIQVGCQFAGRLDTFYAVPTREIANRRLLQRMEACLKRRHENIKNFTLS